MQNFNPHSGAALPSIPLHSDAAIFKKIEAAAEAFPPWSRRSFEQRSQLLLRTAEILRDRQQELAELMAKEMGKLWKDGRAEIEKCAKCCEFYAAEAAGMLADETLQSEARRSAVVFDPMGVILAVMPWNFPFWQVFRFIAPTLMTGNVGLLKHASNVSEVALAIEDILLQAGIPEGVFTTLLATSEQVARVIAHPHVKAVSLTGSTGAGQAVAAAAGQHLKPSLLELGGSDPYIVLADADLDLAAAVCADSRLINAGQSCIAAKRFIVERKIIEDFTDRFRDRLAAKRLGAPSEETSDLGPLARADLRKDLHDQVKRSLASGAQLLLGGEIPKGPGFYYPPTLLSQVRPGMAVFDEETFGPVAALIEAADSEEAIALANRSVFGLGAALFTRDLERASQLARRLEAGSVFVNSLVKSDPRLPFGGIKQSGYGRELGAFGIRAFVNIKTLWMA